MIISKLRKYLPGRPGEPGRPSRPRSPLIPGRPRNEAFNTRLVHPIHLPAAPGNPLLPKTMKMIDQDILFISYNEN